MLGGIQPARYQGPADLVPSITVVVCTYRRPSTLEQCLLAMQRLDLKPSHIVVVDNAPETNASRCVAERFGAEYKIAPIRGVSRARNVGSQPCTSDIIAYIDDDMLVHPVWLEALVAGFASENVAAVTGPVLSMADKDAPWPALLESLKHKPWGTEPFEVSRQTAHWFERANFGGIGDGNFALRRSVFDWWNGFNEMIGRGMPIDIGEEHYAFFQLIEKGYTVSYRPQAIVFHPDAPSDPAQSLHNLSQDLAYAALLARRHPRYIPTIGNFLVQGAIGRRRTWRNWDHGPRELASLGQTLRALAKATRLLGKSRAV
jgi:glycosyltransferase involved in cell wall biosynthesis